MRLGSRTITLIKAGINSLLSKAEEAVGPALIEQTVEDVLTDLERTRQETAHTGAALRTQQSQRSQLEQLRLQAHQAAAQAVARGNDAQARGYLAQRSQYEQHLATLATSISQLQPLFDRQVATLQQLEAKAKELVAHKQGLIAKARLATTYERLHRAEQTFQQLEERVSYRYELSSVTSELQSGSLYGDLPDGTLDSQLMAIKTQLGMLPTNTSISGETELATLRTLQATTPQMRRSAISPLPPIAPIPPLT